MLGIEEIREYCLKKKATSEGFPFNEDVLVFKVMGKMFLLTSLEQGDRINLKCDPELAVELREKYDCVIPGYHMNKQQWNTVILDGSVHKSTILEWIDHSYQQVVATFTKKMKKEFEEL